MDTEAPSITILSPETDSLITEDTVIITGQIEDSTEIALLMINDARIEFHKEERGQEEYSYSFSYNLSSLKMGQNIVSIAAWDRFGNIELKRLKIIREINVS